MSSLTGAFWICQFLSLGASPLSLVIQNIITVASLSVFFSRDICLWLGLGGGDSNCSTDIPCIYRWLYRRYVRFLYRWRNIVEGLVASSVPHINVFVG